MTSGAFSHQVEGTTIQSGPGHQGDHLARGRRGRAPGRPARRRRGGRRSRRGTRRRRQPRPPWSVTADVVAGAGLSRAAASSRTSGPLCRAMVPKKAKRLRRERAGGFAGAPARSGTAFGISRMRSAGDPPGDGSGRAGRRSARGRGRRRRGRASEVRRRSAWRAAACSGKQRRQRVGRGAGAAGVFVRGQHQAVVGADRLVVVEGHHDAAARARAGGAPARSSAPRRSMPVQVDDVGAHLGEDGGERVDPAGAVEPGHHEAVVGAGAEDEVVAVRAERARDGLGPLQRCRGDEEAAPSLRRAPSRARARSWATISVPPGVQSGWSWATWRILERAHGRPSRRRQI